MVAYYVFHGKEKIAVTFSQPIQLDGKLFFIDQIVSPKGHHLWKATLILPGRLHIS